MKTKLITREGRDSLQKELAFLWRKERPEITQKVSWAASLGDRSENADYKYNKRRLHEIDRRIRYLTKCLEEVQVVNYDPCQEGRVFFGAWVELTDIERQIQTFRIVGPEEIYGRSDYASIDSPFARACLKKKINDEVVVKTPTGIKTWYLKKVWYGNEM